MLIPSTRHALRTRKYMSTMYIQLTFHQSLDRLYRKVTGGTVFDRHVQAVRAAFEVHYLSAVLTYIHSIKIIRHRCNSKYSQPYDIRQNPEQPPRTKNRPRLAFHEAGATNFD